MCVQNRKHSSLLLGGSWRAAAQIPRASAEENKPQPEYSPRPPTPTLTGGLRSPNEKEGFDELSCSQTQLNKDSDNWQTGWPQKDSWRWHGGADEGEQRREGDQNKALLPPGPWGAPWGAWFCLCPLLLHQDRHSEAAAAAAWRGLAPFESLAAAAGGSRSLLGHRAASALPLRVYPDTEITRRGLEGGRRKLARKNWSRWEEKWGMTNVEAMTGGSFDNRALKHPWSLIMFH